MLYFCVLLLAQGLNLDIIEVLFNVGNRPYMNILMEPTDPSKWKLVEYYPDIGHSMLNAPKEVYLAIVY